MQKLKIIIPILLITCCLLSCGNDSKENKSIIKETVKTVQSQKNGDDFRARLEATAPATEAQFKDWLPKNVGELNRTEFTKTRISQEDIASAGAMYKDGADLKKLEIKIVDGASKDGLLAIQSHYMAQTLELNNIKPSKYEKTYEKNGLKVLESYVKKDEFYRVSFLYAMRFGITLESNGLSYDEVWQAVGALDLNKLNSL